jgi:hypothetical protein
VAAGSQWWWQALGRREVEDALDGPNGPCWAACGWASTARWVVARWMAGWAACGPKG